MTGSFSEEDGFIGKLSTQESYNTGIVPITNDQNQVTTVQVNDPIGAAYAKFIDANQGSGQTTPSEGDVKYWTASIARELGANASSADIQERMTEHLEFANTPGAVEAFEASAEGQARAGETFAAIAAETCLLYTSPSPRD